MKEITKPEAYTVGASMIAHTILGGSLFNYSTMGPKNSVLIIQAPTLTA